ncbi:MAG: hypothetical protein HC840_02615 [Leptolyngbyaceae cyanobacterium RM2_2_4]|nr:hypothetical protein [Leptolyngbyaceae cyanobacterium RM2_2_4]NJO66203.1 hypothetical protein [Leptolyngbyaceae cyanobacterium RM1_405_57]
MKSFPDISTLVRVWRLKPILEQFRQRWLLSRTDGSSRAFTTAGFVMNSGAAVVTTEVCVVTTADLIGAIAPSTIATYLSLIR